MIERRLKNFRISEYFIDMLFKNKMSNIPLVTEGLPEDAKLVRILLDYKKDELIFTYQHESFLPIADGMYITDVNIIFKDMRYPEKIIK